jgi:DNA-binding transcriptional ArsR family regulator
MTSPKEQLVTVLETHFCDLNNTIEHESMLEKASDEYFQDKNLGKYVKIFESLSDEKRLKILHLLTFREMCNCELTAATKSTQPNLSYHIKKLENAGLVKKRREGKYIYYSLDETMKQKLLEIIGVKKITNQV